MQRMKLQINRMRFAMQSKCIVNYNNYQKILQFTYC